MSRPNPERDRMLTDLTRWNRAGLKRFDYVNGDAAVWLEELRLALFGLYLRGKPLEDRVPERWRDLFLQDMETWGEPEKLSDYAASVAWARLAPALPPRPEDRGQRNRRLLDQYRAAQNGDQAWEIARAFARAAHVHLGHVNAFANEGYLRTATQWESLRRLAAMLNYQPGPPASATTLVALTMKEGGGTIEVPKGLAAKYTPVTGGAPKVFETLSAVTTHPDLNAARVRDWNRNATNLPGGAQNVAWLSGPKTVLAPGGLAVLSLGATGQTGRARALANVVQATGPREEALWQVRLDQPLDVSAKANEAQLWVAPEDVRRGEPVTGNGRVVVEIAGAFSATKGDIVQLSDPSAHWEGGLAVVLEARGNALVLDFGDSLPAEVEIESLAPLIADAGGYVLTTKGPGRIYFAGPSGIVWLDRNDPQTYDQIRQNNPGDNYFLRPKGRGGFKRGFMPTAGAKVTGRPRPASPEFLPGQAGDATRSASFAGKPPKSLALNSWFVARDTQDGSLRALRVTAISTSSGLYHLMFDAEIGSAPDATEFHGPMTEALRPQYHDRNPSALSASGPVLLAGLSEQALSLLKPGRNAILHHETPEGVVGDILATITGAKAGPDAGLAEVTWSVPTPTGDADNPATWQIGDVVVRLNTVTLGHGESKGPRLLGSGDAERPEQSFRLAVKEVSHIPSSAAEAGVVPDIDVAVDGTVWPWRDTTDMTAEGTRAWSSAMTEDGEVTIRFRRRLPTGSNNVTVLRHRVGTGAGGTGIAPLSFTKPMKKHPHVEAISQPFPTSGGADREPVESLRASAPSRLAANGRAVSLDDFQRLAAGLSTVWRARAVELPGAGILRHIRLTVVPAAGAPLTPGLEDQLRPAILSKAIPGVRLSFIPFDPLKLHIAAEVRADLTSFDMTDVKADCEAALIRDLGLQGRDFGQAFHVAEALAVLEAVPQVETAVITRLDLGPAMDLSQPIPAGDKTWPANVAIRDGAVVAIFPRADQVAFVPEPGNGQAATVSVTVRGL